MTNSILFHVKKTLGVDESVTEYDDEIIMSINNSISNLRQMGVGPIEGFYVVDDTQEWTDLCPDMKKFQSVKTYVSLTTRLAFDPPTSTTHNTTIKEVIKESEFRLLSIDSE